MPRQIGGPRARIEYALANAAGAALGAMPLKTAVGMGARLGAIAMAVDRFNRPIAMRNLEIAFPELPTDARLQILRESYRNWGRMVAEWTHIGKLDRGNIERLVIFDRQRHEEFKARKQGALILTAHFGNFELLGAASSIFGHPAAIVQRPLRNPFVHSQVERARTLFGNRVIGRKGAAREIVSLLRQGWLVAIALDLDVRRGVFVDFFSLPASTSEGLARIAMATGASVLPIFMVREGLLHRMLFMPEIEPVKVGSREDSVRENTQRYTAAIEAAIRLHPDHWNWVHRRWKTRPPGEKRFY